MAVEQPLVGLGEIATFLKVSTRKAREMIHKCRAPLLIAYKPMIAVMPSDLLEAMRLQRIKKP